MPKTTPTKHNDFDTNDLVRVSDEHEKSLGELRKAVKSLEKRVGDNAALALSFKDAFENDKKMDAVLVTLITDLILKDDDLKEAISKSVNKMDRAWWTGARKRIIAVTGAVLLLIIGAVVQALVAKYLV